MNPVDSVDSCGFYWQLAGPFLFSNLNLNVELRTVPAIHSPFWFDVSSATEKPWYCICCYYVGFPSTLPNIVARLLKREFHDCIPAVRTVTILTLLTYRWLNLLTMRS